MNEDTRGIQSASTSGWLASSPSRQIDPGSYTVWGGTIGGSPPPQQVGWCYVEAGPGNVKVEHYAMFNGYTPPGPGEQLLLKPTGPGGPDFSSLVAFIDAMKQQEPPGAPYSYIESHCTYHAGLP